jgi:hypothetical protein
VIEISLDDLPCLKLKHLGAQMLQEKLSKMTETEQRAFREKANTEFVKKKRSGKKGLPQEAEIQEEASRGIAISRRL